MVIVALGLVILALGAGVTVRYEVLQGRNQVATKPVTDFSSCLEAQGDLDVTGTVCTDATGSTFTKPGATVTSTPIDAPAPAGTSTVPTTTPQTTAPLSLGVATTFFPHDTKTIVGGTVITLNAIHDSRCKPGVQCIWAGEFSTDWTITNGTSSEIITLGTVRNITHTKEHYTYTLADTNLDHASLVVTKATTTTPTH